MNLNFLSNCQYLTRPIPNPIHNDVDVDVVWFCSFSLIIVGALEGFYPTFMDVFLI